MLSVLNFEPRQYFTHDSKVSVVEPASFSQNLSQNWVFFKTKLHYLLI